MNFDLNIKNYSVKELVDMFDLPLNYDKDTLEMKEAQLRGNIMNNKEINIENSSQIRSSYYNRYSRINYKMVINLYNDALKGDTFTIAPI